MKPEGIKEERNNDKAETMNSGVSVEGEKKELTSEEQELLERQRRDEARMERVLYRQEIIRNWASQRVNFIAIILLVFFMLVIVFSYLLRPPTPIPIHPPQTSPNTK